MTITSVESSNPGSFHPLHIQLTRFHEREQRTLVACTRPDFPRGSTSVTLRLESIVRPCSVSQHPLEKCVSRHTVLSGPGSNVQSQRSCCSLNSLMCSFNSSNTLVLCTVDWLQDGRARMTECSTLLSQQSHRRFTVASQSRFLSPQLVHK